MSEAFHHITIGGEDTDGNNSCFVWLHGWGHDHSSLSRLAQLFKNHGQHYLFDLPGFGKSVNPDTGAGTADYADMLAAELHKLTRGPCVFVGHSFGGRVSVQMAARHPELVKAVILIGGAGLQRKRTIVHKLRATALRMLGKLARLSDQLFKTTLRDKYSQRYGSADYKAAGELRPTFVRVVNEDLSEQARQTQCPALLIYGSEDDEAPPEIGLKFESLMQNSQYHELPGFGHLDILDRGAYQCQALITDFLKSQA